MYHVNTEFFVAAIRVFVLHSLLALIRGSGAVPAPDPLAATDLVSVISSSYSSSGICGELGEPCAKTSDCCSSFPTLRALGFSTFSLGRNKSTGVECLAERCACGRGFVKKPYGILLTCVPESELSHPRLPESPLRNKPGSHSEGLTYIFWFGLVLLFKGLFVCFCLGKRRANAEARDRGQDRTDGASIPKRDLPPSYDVVVRDMREAPPPYEEAVNIYGNAGVTNCNRSSTNTNVNQ